MAENETIDVVADGQDGNSITGVNEYYYAAAFDEEDGSHTLPVRGSSS